jgi:hypothetical protein
VAPDQAIAKEENPVTDEALNATARLFEMAGMSPDDQAELKVRIHGSCQAYDDGHRQAIIGQLLALEQHASRQAERSEQTARSGDEPDRQNHQWDQQVAMVLRTLRQASAHRRLTHP